MFNRNGGLVAPHHTFQSGEMLKQHYPDVVQHPTGGGSGPWHEGLAWRGFDKRGFLSTNRLALSRLLADDATRQGEEYPDLAPLTRLDLWACFAQQAR